MSAATVVTLGFGSFGTVNLAVLLGFGAGSPAPPVFVIAPGGGGDKRRADRDEYYRKKRAKRARELRSAPRLREEPIKVIEHEPAVQIIDLRPQQKLFAAVAPPNLPRLPPTTIRAAEPYVPQHDEDDLFMLTE